MALRPGDPVAVRFTKWGGGAHWEFPVTFLGDDGLGTWCGAPAGTWLERPGASFASGPHVTMVDLTRRTADELMAAAAVGHEPFGPAGSRWLARLAASTP